MSELVVIGAGVMGETVIGGLVRSGWAPNRITAVDRYQPRLDEIRERYGVGSADLTTAVQGADTIVVVVKPQDAGALLPQVAQAMRSDAVVVSLCAGITLSTIEQSLPEGAAVVRVMPNTPAQVAAGMSAVSGGQSASATQVDAVTELLRPLGEVVVVPEKYLDAVTALSGSGPAYIFLVTEAMIDAGVLLGLPRDIATTLVKQTVYGSAKLMTETGDHPTTLRERVTSPGGTTAAALRELEAHGLRSAFVAAAEAARNRSQELG